MYRHLVFHVALRRLVQFALLAAAAAAPAQAARVDAILHGHREHGYPSPRVAMQQLKAAADRPGPGAPAPLRQRYHAALADYAIADGDRAAAVGALRELERLAQQGCDPCEVQWRSRQALVAVTKGDADAARGHLAKAATALPSPPPELRLDLALARTALHQLANEPARAIETALEAADLAARSGEPARQASLLGMVVQANISRGDLDRAMSVADETYALARRIGYGYEMALTRTNQAYILGDREDYPRFHAALVDALRLSQAVPGMDGFVLTTLVNLSAYHIYVGEYRESIAVTRRAERLARAQGDELSRAFAISNRGSAMARLGQVDAGLALMQQASEVANRAGDKRASVDLLAEKVKVYELVGRPADALAALHRVVGLNRELVEGQRDATVLALQEKFSAERKTHEIQRLSAENARRQAELAARTAQQRFWAALAVALALSALLLTQWLRRARDRNRALASANAVLAAQSAHDPLTGTFNRRYGERLMGQQQGLLDGAARGARDRHYRASVGLLLLDIDHFKQVNDRHGHAAGDAVLVAVARRLQSLLRGNDAVVRWGGEEFLLVLPGTEPGGLAAVARRVLEVIAAEPVAVDGRTIRVSASIGAVAWPFCPGQHWAEALQVADLALYRAKARGRNQAICLAGIAAGASLDRVRHDLSAAEAVGEVVLETVAGPAAGCEAPAASEVA